LFLNFFPAQDDNLDVLSYALDRTKNIGVAIGDELNEHQKLLGDLETGVDKTKGVSLFFFKIFF
jgi:hypothetical protein